jgi:hypothetical protein
LLLRLRLLYRNRARRHKQGRKQQPRQERPTACLRPPYSCALAPSRPFQGKQASTTSSNCPGPETRSGLLQPIRVHRLASRSRPVASRRAGAGKSNSSNSTRSSSSIHHPGTLSVNLGTQRNPRPRTHQPHVSLRPDPTWTRPGLCLLACLLACLLLPPPPPLLLLACSYAACPALVAPYLGRY